MLSACGGGGGGSPAPPPPPPPPPPTYTVGGTVSGLAGSGLVLRNNGGNDLAIAANGAFAFTTSLASGAAYSVSMQSQPMNPAQTCTIASGGGNVAGANVTNVAVTCVNIYNVGGTITGLSGTGLVLRNNGEDRAVAAGDTSFTFATPVPSGGSYGVTVATHPSGQTCTVSNGTGNAVGQVTSVAVECVAGYTVGGTVTGLFGTGLVLSNNGGDLLTINADGAFTFRTLVAAGAPYDVLASAHPLNPDQECTTTRGTGTANAIVTDIAINCYIMGKRLFGTNGVAGVLTGATINQTAGTLASVPGVPVAVGGGALRLIAPPVGQSLYVVNGDTATIKGYNADPATGAITAMSNNPVATGGLPIDTAIDPINRFLYSTDQLSSRLFGFRIGPTGELTSIPSSASNPGSPYTTAAPTIYVRIDPGGNFAYVVTRAPLDQIALSSYSIEALSGALTPVGPPIAVGTSMPMPGAMQLTADGGALFILASPQPLLYAYKLAAGVPAPMSGNPFTLPTGFLVRPHPRLPVMYVGGTDSIAAYRVVGTTLQALTGSPFAFTGAPWEIVFDPGARFMYVSSASGIATFEVDGNGALTPLIGNNLLATPFPPDRLLADPGGRYLFISEFGTGKIQSIAINTRNGRPSLVPGSPFDDGTGAGAAVITK